jgi:hypothetical protein
MKQIKLKDKTKARINDLNQKAEQIKAIVNDMLLTVLEHEEIEINDFDIKYENGVIILNDKLKKDK